MKTLAWKNHTLQLLDQTRLPGEERYLCCTRWQEVRDAIRVLAVRGAPAIGVAAAYGMVLAARDIASAGPDKRQFEVQLEEAGRDSSQSPLGSTEADEPGQKDIILPHSGRNGRCTGTISLCH